MKQLKLSIFMLSLLLVFALAGCGNDKDEVQVEETPVQQEETPAVEDAAGPNLVTDMAGVEVEIPEEVNSVVNVWPSSNQMMILLGATDKQTAYFATLQKPSFTWMQIVNPNILEKPTVGLEGSVTAEELLNVNPDLVITANADDAELFRQAGLTAITAMFNNFDGMKQSLILTAESLGGDAPDRAAKYIEYLEGNIALVAERLADVKDEDKPSVYYLDGQSGKTAFLTSGTGTMQEEWITMAGGKLATDGLFEGMSKEITPEQLLTLDPDYILVGGLNQAASYDALMADPSLSSLSAITNEKVVRIPQGTFQWDRFGSEAALQVLWTAKTLYPELFEDIDMKAETINFYKNFLNYDLSAEYADAILAGKNAPDGK